MSILSGKLGGLKSSTKLRGFFNWLGKRLAKFWRAHSRCLILAAVILGIFGFLEYRRPAMGGIGSMASSTWVSETLIEETADTIGEQLLGGSFNLGAVEVPVAQASVDFSADDELENQDLAIMEGSGLTAPNTPASGSFANMSREVATYVVQSGDSPSSIAVKFGINVDTILWANNLRDGDLIKPGQSLMVLPINGVRVKISAKDTIAVLAKKYKGKESEISAFNNIYEDSKLVAGNFIIIPDGEPVAVVIKSSPKVTAPQYAQNKTQLGKWLIAPAAGRVWSRLHSQNGVDISNACGTPLYASAAGTIILADTVGWNYGYGKYIMIRHSNGVVTLYGHTSRILVEVGQSVEQGQLIALMGSTGRSSGCHVHWEVRGATNPLGTRR